MKRTAILLLTGIVLLQACIYGGHGRKVHGDGHVITQDKQFGDITGVESGGSFDVYVTEGSTTTVKIEGEENIISHIDMQWHNGMLSIGTDNNVWLNPQKDVKIYITSPHYNKLAVSGSGNMTSQTKITNDNKLELGCSGSGDMKLDVDAPEVAMGVSGSGDIELAGETKKFTANVSGAGNIKAFELKTEEAALEISGTGEVEVNPSTKLNASISGMGEIHYKGNPEITKNISGMGEIRKVD